MYKKSIHINSKISIGKTYLQSTLFVSIPQSHKSDKPLIDSTFPAWWGNFFSLHVACFYSLFKSDKQPLKYYNIETLCYIHGGKIVVRHCGKHSQSPKRIQKMAEQVRHDNIESLRLAQGNKKPIAHCKKHSQTSSCHAEHSEVSKISPVEKKIITCAVGHFHKWKSALSLVPFLCPLYSIGKIPFFKILKY